MHLQTGKYACVNDAVTINSDKMEKMFLVGLMVLFLTYNIYNAHLDWKIWRPRRCTGVSPLGVSGITFSSFCSS